MLDILYSYIFSPVKTVQLQSHIKNWKLWWIIVAITALISIIQVSEIGLFSLGIHIVTYIIFICITSMIIDAVAQLLGSKSRLRTLIYWFAFANSLFWISPSIIMIQEVFSSLGALVMMILNGFFVYYTWVTLKYIYNFSNVKVLSLFFIPIISIVVAIFSITIYSAQWIASLL